MTEQEKLLTLQVPEGTRRFFDPDKLREWVKDSAKNAFDQKLNALESNDYKLKVRDLAYPDKRFSLNDQKAAILEKRDLSLPLHGVIELHDKRSGNKITEKKTILAHIPYITDRNTNILNGSEYVVINQQRLKPGVYTRIKESGEAEAHVNVAPGSGLSGKVVFYPETAIFVYELGTTQIKLYGLLKKLGILDQQMEQAWGKEILEKNKRGFVGDELDKFYNRITQR